MQNLPPEPIDYCSALQPEVIEQLRKIRDLPTLPTAFMGIMRVLREPNAPVKQVARLVEADQAIAMKILRLINSSFYGLARRVDSVQQGIVLLGTKTLKNVVISASVFKALGEKSESTAFDREAFWQHAIGCGAIARFLGDKIGCGREEEGFISGIIHDIGKVVLDQYFHDKLLDIMNLVKSNDLSFYQAELELGLATHADIGAALAEIWGLPPNLVDIIALHHDLGRPSMNPQLVALIQVSDMLARKYHVGSGGDDSIPDVDPLAWSRLSLNEAQIESWDAELRDELLKGKEVLDLLMK